MSLALASGGTVTPAADTTAPSVPAGFKASAASSSQINLSWSASSDAVGVTGYRIFRNGVAIANVNALSYSNSGLSASTSYSYAVAAYDAAGNLSAQSAASSATTMAAPVATNLLSNSGFESGLTGWSTWGNSVVVTSPVYVGSSALKVGTGVGGVYQNVTSQVKAGSTYTLKFAAQLGSASDQTGEIGIEFFNSSGTVIFDKHVIPSSTSYTSQSLSFTAPAGFTQALVYVYKNSGASYIYADGLSLTAP
jgi:hypothetical protein